MNGEWSMPEMRTKALEAAGGSVTAKTTSSSKASSREHSVVPEDRKDDSNDVPTEAPESVKVSALSLRGGLLDGKECM